jgi:hypothetical protein
MAVMAIGAVVIVAIAGCTQSTSSTIAQTAPVIKAEGHATTVSLGMR